MLVGIPFFELAGLDCHRALDNVDKDREAGYFLPLEPTGRRMKSPTEQFITVGKNPT